MKAEEEFNKGLAGILGDEFVKESELKVRKATPEDYDEFGMDWAQPKHENIVAVDTGRKGFARTRELVGVSAYDPENKELTQLWVSPKHRRQGVATKMVQAHSGDIERASAATRPEARQFYQSMGLERTGKTRGGQIPMAKAGEEKPLRDRVEVYGVDKDGKVIASEYPDGSVATFGGGIEKGESPDKAARREYKEESGLKIKNVEPLPVKPLEKEWSAVDKPHSKKMKERMKEYRGSRTLYMVGEVYGTEGEITDKSPVKGATPKSIAELIAEQKAALKSAKPDVEDMLRSRLRVLTKLKSLQKVAEFAPGIPVKGKIHSIPKVKPTAENQEWDLSMAKHPAKKRGDHIDLRVVDPKGRAHSWALPTDLPQPGKSTYAVRQPTHTAEYSLQTKPFDLPEGYGETRPGEQVEPISVGKTEVVEAGPSKVRFLRHLGAKTDEFVLRKIKAPAADRKEMWAFHNATKTRNTAEGRSLPDSKPGYRRVEPENLNLDNPETVLSAKIDGAHTLTHLHGKERHARVYSYRRSSSDPEKLLEHTHKLPHFQERTSPDKLKNTVLRTELWFSDEDGKAIPSSKISGILNSGTLKARRTQEELGVKPRLTVIDVVRSKGRNMEKAPYEDKLKIMEEAAKYVDGLELPPLARTPEEKRRLIADVKGALPHTSEGVVEHDLHTKGAPYTKAVFKPMHDVFVREILEEQPGVLGGRNMAAGFKYSFTPDGPVAGKVGTGFDHKTKKDMLNNPEKYVGRVAVVKSMSEKQNRQDPSQIKALRSPAFKHWHLDKSDPELMKEAQFDPLVGRIRTTTDRLSSGVRGFDPIALSEAIRAKFPEMVDYTKTGKGIKATMRELGMMKGAAKQKDYGPGGKWIHDRAHKIMRGKEGTKGQYGDKEGKSIAYAIATQQAHAVKKSPKGFKTPIGVRTAKAKYDKPKEMRKTAFSLPMVALQNAILGGAAGGGIGAATAAAAAPTGDRRRAALEGAKRGAILGSIMTGAAAPVTSLVTKPGLGLVSKRLAEGALPAVSGGAMLAAGPAAAAVEGARVGGQAREKTASLWSDPLSEEQAAAIYRGRK